MKMFLIITLIMVSIVTSAYSQTKSRNRYFQITYLGQDTLGSFRYGTYFIETSDNYFPSLEEVRKIVINGYNLNFSYDSKKISITLTEFKNKAEWIKFNHK